MASFQESMILDHDNGLNSTRNKNSKKILPLLKHMFGKKYIFYENLFISKTTKCEVEVLKVKNIFASSQKLSVIESS